VAWHKLSFVLILAFLLLVIALLPFALSSLLGYIIRPQSNRIYSLFGANAAPAAAHARLHLDILSLDEWNSSAQIRVAGSHICEVPCTQTDQISFVASPELGDLAEGLPPSQSVSFPPNGTRVTQVITLPVVGQPIRFPFDTYRLGLGVIFEGFETDGTTHVLTEKGAEGHLFLTLQTHVVRTVMGNPTPESTESLGLEAPGAVYVDGWEMSFERPAYLKVLTVLLVLLVVVAAIYAVFLRPLAELVINAGALVLGIWGIRSILLGSSPPSATLVDLTLSMVILFLLLAIVARALWYHRTRGQVHLRRTRRGSPTDDSS